jgi:indole-3-glycerol phosphate synthase
LADQIPSNVVKISESGLESKEELLSLFKVGYSGFLIGEKFMKSSHPDKQADIFIRDWMTIRPEFG